MFVSCEFGFSFVDISFFLLFYVLISFDDRAVYVHCPSKLAGVVYVRWVALPVLPVVYNPLPLLDS